ncbi:MAG: hypothetical protein JRN23_04290 [Nitrososphaerota archaeon]|nr:hypothetical protein [Nitrososphaerota archaeon]
MKAASSTKSLRIVTTQGLIYDFELGPKSTFKRLRRKVLVKHPAQMKVTTATSTESTTIDATVLKVEIRTAYVREVREE